ncbi:MAG: hypothetical protein ICV73_29545 [Acetobacteraceae bacterium]|nr:hypothetical protein [Acetobacteraceae bacterium]
MRRPMRAGLAAGGIVACLALAWTAGKVGLARLLVDYAVRAEAPQALAAAEEAARISALDPEAHYALALTLAEAGQDEKALTALRRAASLRPAD